MCIIISLFLINLRVTIAKIPENVSGLVIYKIIYNQLVILTKENYLKAKYCTKHSFVNSCKQLVITQQLNLH